MKRMKIEKGITLITLIITIVILLILAVVAITGIQQDGIFSHANNAATKYNTAMRDENVAMGNYGNWLIAFDSNSECMGEHNIERYYEYIGDGMHNVCERCKDCGYDAGCVGDSECVDENDDGTCDICGGDEQEKVECTHSWQWVVDVEASCTESGIKYRECVLCMEMGEIEEIPATGHVDDGNDNEGLYSICGVCGARY